MEVGWIGLGNMGLAMARNVLGAGHRLTVHNRTLKRAEELTALGANVAKTPAEAAASGCVVTMLSDDAAVEDVILGSGRVLAALPADGIHVCTSTISVALAKRLTEAHQEAGQNYVSAPVFGRPEAARDAKLYVVAAGSSPIVRKLQPIFDAIGQHTFVVGEDAATANVVKLSGNFLIASLIESLGEAFALVRKYGVDLNQYLDLLTSSLFNAPVYKTYGRLIANNQFEPAGFAMPLGLKDIRLALAAAENASVPMPIANLVHENAISCLAQGWEKADWSALARLAAKNAGLE